MKIIVNNKNLPYSMKIKSFDGGVVRLDSSIISRAVNWSSTSSFSRIPAHSESEADIWVALDKAEYLEILKQKKEKNEIANWDIGISFSLETFWGDLSLKRTDLPLKEIPHIGAG